MKTEYEKARGRPRLWFSMWRYEYCDFVELCKYGMGIGAYVNVGFPDEHDIMYDFEPRLPKPPPPDEPVYRDEFWAHYYHQDCPSLIDWRRYQKHRWSFCDADTEALNAIPKRNVETDMKDVKRIQFYGLYAKEKRSFARVLTNGVLCNVPSVIFFFLWLFQWKHGSDLQNAMVPLTPSLTLTLGFVGIVFGTRENNEQHSKSV